MCAPLHVLVVLLCSAYRVCSGSLLLMAPHPIPPFIVVFLLLLETILFCSQPFWKKSGESNFVSGKIKMGKETLCRIEGKWVSWLMYVEFVEP